MAAVVVVMMMTLPLFCPQDEYLTIAEALQAAVRSVLEDDDLRHKKSLYYWAALLSHGFASVRLDDTLLDQIHDRLQTLYGQQPDDDGQENDIESDVMTATLTLTRNAYHRLEEREETLSREWSEKWGAR